MNVRGMAFEARQNQIVSDFGIDRWEEFMEKFRESHPEFPQSILPTTWIPIEQFIGLGEALIKEFYYQDEKEIYILWGEKSAEHAMREGGPLHILVKKKGLNALKNFINKILPSIWPIYYDEGRTETKLEGNIIHGHTYDLPKYYAYFEYTVLGFVLKELELIGFTVKETIVIKRSAKEIYRKYILDL